MAFLLTLALALLAAFTGCSSSPGTNSGDAPAWTRQPARNVDAGYIVYLGVASDRSLEMAQFKAEAIALEDLANECSFAPKGTRVEDRYYDVQDGMTRAYAKVAVEFQDCESARKSISPDEIQKLANQPFTEEIKRYQDLLKEEGEGGPEEEQVAENNANPAVNNTSNPGGSGGGPAPIRNTTSFFIVSQQVSYQKQVVILSPPGSYPPGAPQTTQFVNNVTPLQQNVNTYRAANPELRTTSRSWSQVAAPSRPSQGRNGTGSRRSSSMNSRGYNQRGNNNHGGGSYNRNGSNGGGGHPPPRRRRRNNGGRGWN